MLEDLPSATPRISLGPNILGQDKGPFRIYPIWIPKFSTCQSRVEKSFTRGGDEHSPFIHAELMSKYKHKHTWSPWNHFPTTTMTVKSGTSRFSALLSA